MQKSYSTNMVFIASCAGLAFFGVAMLSLGPILTPLQAVIDGAYALPSTMSIGILLGTILFGPVVDKFGYKWLLVASSLITLMGLQGLAIFKDINLLHISIFMLGLGGGILNGETNAVVAEIYDDSKRGTKLAILGACYCVGALIWTLLNYFVEDYTIPLNVASVVMVGCIAFFCCINFPPAKPSENVTFSNVVGLLKYPSLILFALVLFFQSAFEGTSGSYTISFLGNYGGLAESDAELSLTWFTIGMLAGRLILGSVMAKLKELKTLYAYLAVAVAGVVLLHLYKNDCVTVYVAMALIGFGVGATYPVILNYIGGAFRDLQGTAFSIAMFIALCGQYAGNKIVGMEFELGNYGFLTMELVLCILIMMCIVPVAIKLSKKK